MLIRSSCNNSVCPFPLLQDQNNFTKLGLKVTPPDDAPDMYFIIFCNHELKTWLMRELVTLERN